MIYKWMIAWKDKNGMHGHIGDGTYKELSDDLKAIVNIHIPEKNIHFGQIDYAGFSITIYPGNN